MQTKCIWYVEKKNPKWIERVNFEMYSSCMQRVLAPHKILFLYGASIPASVISWQPARTKVLLPPPEHLAFWKAGGPFTGTKIMWNMLGGRRQAKAADLRGCKGGGQPGLAAREATRNQVQNLNLQWIQCKALQHIAAMSIHPSQKWWCLWKGQSHRENTKGCCDEWKSWAASWDLQRFGSRNSFFFFFQSLCLMSPGKFRTSFARGAFQHALTHRDLSRSWPCPDLQQFAGKNPAAPCAFLLLVTQQMTEIMLLCFYW